MTEEQKAKVAKLRQTLDGLRQADPRKQLPEFDRLVLLYVTSVTQLYQLEESNRAGAEDTQLQTRVEEIRALVYQHILEVCSLGTTAYRANADLAKKAKDIALNGPEASPGFTAANAVAARDAVKAAFDEESCPEGMKSVGGVCVPHNLS